MKLVLHVFKKDVRRLWPGTALSLLLLAAIANTDRWRFDTVIGLTEGWLNLLLPLAWACLIGLAVLEEPLAGDRHFWLTRPHRRFELLASKLLFAIVFVHVPVFVAHIYVQAAHGFGPGEWFAPELGRQVLLAATITLPAIAIATLAGGFTQFMMMLLGAAAVAIVCSGEAFRSSPMIMRPLDYLRPDAIATLIAIGAALIAILQYRRRKVILARTLALSATLCAGVLYAYVPETVEYRVRSRLHPAGPVALRLDTRKPDTPRYAAAYLRETVGIPVLISGIPSDSGLRFGPLDLTLTAADGTRYQAVNVNRAGSDVHVALFARFQRFPSDASGAAANLVMQFDRGLYAKLAGQHVRASGRVAVTFLREGNPTWMPLRGRVEAAGIGHCSNEVVENPYSLQAMVKVLCESPSHLPQDTRVTVAIPETGRQWNRSLGESANFTSGPHWAWVSPLERGKIYFPISDPRNRSRSGYYMELPAENLENAHIAVRPIVPSGFALVEFDFGDVVMAQYRVATQAER